MTLVITTCSNRKRRLIADGLRMSAVPNAPIDDLAADWVRRLTGAADMLPAHDVYAGRSFREAVLASVLLDARLMVASAGVGLIQADCPIPSYDCTILADSPDSVATRVAGDYSPAAWWRKLGTMSPFAQPLASAAEAAGGLICAALSGAYIDLIAEELRALPGATLQRLRLFTRAPLGRVPPNLQTYVMPYDDRLDGPDSPVRGTRGDFAGRALHHFAKYVVTDRDRRSAADHSSAVERSLAGWRLTERFDRQRLDDAAILDLIRKHWDDERGSASRMLRRFRDDLNIACEQGRFADLARHVKAERT